MPERKINEIIVHCSATPPHMDIGVKEIRQWHVRDRGWSDIGYHVVIRRDGTIEDGRPMNVAGAHCRGHNAHSIGVCLVGGVDKDNKPQFNFTADQARTLRYYVGNIKDVHPHIKLSGHRDYNHKKNCPCFDVRRWWRTGRWEG